MNSKLLIKSIQVLFVRGFGGTAAFFVTLSVTHLLSPNEAGIVLFVIGMIASLGQIMTFGTSEVILKFVSSYSDNSWTKVNKVFSSLLKVVVFFGASIVILGFIFSEQIAIIFFENSGMLFFVMLLPIGVLAMAVNLMTSSAILGLNQTFLGSILQSCLLPIFFLLCCLAFTYAEIRVDKLDITLAYIGSVVFVSIITLSIWFKNKNVDFIVKASISMDVWSSVKPLFVVMLMQVLTLYAGQYATALLLFSSDIALFSAAQRTAMLVSLTLNAVNLVIAPKFSLASYNNDREQLNVLALKSSKLMILLASPAILIFTLYSELIMGLFGKEFVAASDILIILAIGQFVNVATGSVGYLLIMTGHERDFRNVIIVSGTLTLLVSFLLTHYFGLHGAAIATAVGLSMQNLLAAYFVKLRLGFNTLNIFRKLVKPS